MQEERKVLAALTKIPLLAGLQPEQQNRLAERMDLLEVRRRRVVFLPGDPGKSIFFLTSGRVKLSRVTRDGKELTLSYLRPGEVFGEQCLVTGGPREEMAETMENAVLLELPREDFEALLTSEARVGAEMTHMLCQRRLDLERKVEDLVFKDVSAKLAELLLRLGQRYGQTEERGLLLEVKMTHQEMANLIGSTRETVSLTLSQYKRDGLILTEGRKIILLSVEGLKALT